MRKMMSFGLAALMLGLLSTSCVDQIVPVAPEREQAQQTDLCTITATIDAGATKTALDGLNVVWKTGDVIKVYSETAPNGVNFTLSTGAGSSTATFTGGEVGAGPYYAVYPASGASGTLPTLHMDIPAVQTYASSSFGPGANIAVAKGNDKDALQFYNAGGLLRLTIKGSKTVKRINLYTNGTDVLQGQVTVNNSTNPPTLVYPTFNETNGTVALDCGAGVTLTSDGTQFYFFLPFGSMADGYQVEIIDTEDKAMLQYATASSGNAMERSVIRPMPAFDYVQTYNANFLTSTVLAGGFCNVNAASLSNPVACTETAGQYAYKVDATERFTRIQNWSDGYALTVTTPAALDPGASANASFAVQGGIGGITPVNHALRVVKKFGGRIWLVNEENKDGFIVR